MSATSELISPEAAWPRPTQPLEVGWPSLSVFLRTKAWKESPDPDREPKLDRIEEVLDRSPDRTFACDEFGPHCYSIGDDTLWGVNRNGTPSTVISTAAKVNVVPRTLALVKASRRSPAARENPRTRTDALLGAKGHAGSSNRR